MTEQVVIRKNPIVLIRNLVILQFGVSIAFFGAGALGNYHELFNQLNAAWLISYDLARFLFMVLGELTLLALVFFQWFFNADIVSRDKLVRERGILWKRRRVIPLTRPLSASCHYGRLSKIFLYGSIVIQSKHVPSPIVLAYVSNPKTHMRQILEQNREADSVTEEKEMSLSELIRAREQENLEFKTTLRWDARRNIVSKDVERAALKTVAAFLNSRGGYLVLGVDDNQRVVGLETDYRTLSRRTQDGFENHFTNVFKEMIGPEFRPFVRLAFHSFEGKDVCLVRVLPAPKPAYAKLEKNESFFIRTGNSTTALQLSEAAAYIRSRWRES